LYINSATAATILVYGDSLSAGYGLGAGEGWVSLLEKRLRDERFDYEVINASISGETSAGGASRIEGSLARVRPSMVVLELGANDGLRGLPVSEMKSNLGRIIEACRNAGAGVLLVGLRLPPNYGRSYTEAFARAFPELAKQYRVPLVPFMLEGFAERRDAFQSDGLHPTREAQKLILDNIWPTLEPVLQRKTNHASSVPLNSGYDLRRGGSTPQGWCSTAWPPEL
jgi:acyl-CoA thioesterase-1